MNYVLRIFHVIYDPIYVLLDYKFDCFNNSTGDPRLMQISLVRISLLRYFKTFQSWLMQFLAILGPNFALMK